MKKITRVMKIATMGGEASPAKLGQKLGPYGIGAKFCTEFNAKTADRKGDLVPCVLTIYDDKSFDIVLKTTPVTFLLKKAAKVEKGNADVKNPPIHLSADEIKKIAEYKMPEMNVSSLEAAIRCIEGTAKSMGIVID